MLVSAHKVPRQTKNNFCLPWQKPWHMPKALTNAKVNFNYCVHFFHFNKLYITNWSELFE